MKSQKKRSLKKRSAMKRENVKETTAAFATKKTTSKEQSWFSDMNQIDWFPVDPYCD